MVNYLNNIKKKIIKEIDLEDINIVNNSENHRGHLFFDEKKFHLQLNIRSKYLNSLNRIDAQKLVMKVLKEELKNTIHALEINIK